MKKNRGMVLLALALALVNFACANVITTKEADFRSGSDKEGKQRGKLEDRDELSQNDKSDDSYNVQITDRKFLVMTKFENVPADEDRLIKDMEVILQEKMSKDYPACEPNSLWSRISRPNSKQEYLRFHRPIQPGFESPVPTGRSNRTRSRIFGVLP
jgi:hypothetical protein